MPDNYGTVAGANAYHAERGNSGWTGTDAEKAAALLVASEALDGRYRSVFPGYRATGRAQRREWPRSLAIDAFGNGIPVNVTPVEVEYAVYELALRHRIEPGSLFPDFVPGEAIRQFAVPGAVSVTLASGSSASDFTAEIPIVDAILTPIIGTNAGSPLSGRAVRVS